MKRVGPGANGLAAFDISHYEPKIDWTKIKQSFGLVMIKASEGESRVDPMFVAHWRNAGSAGLRRIAYHFYHPAQDPLKQAQNFLRVCGQLEEMDGIMLDWEASDNLAASIDSAHGQATVASIERLFNKIPFMYGSPYFLQTLNLPDAYHDNPLVIAEYGVSAPLVPPPWTEPTIWQDSESASISGVLGTKCDSDIFYGTKAELDDLLISLNLPVEKSTVQ